MIALTRIARRLVRKVVKPVALWLATVNVHRAQAKVASFERLIRGVTPHDLKLKAVQQVARRNRIAGW
jgi:hypothetical protein